MISDAADARERNHPLLFTALTCALETLARTSDPVAALRESFSSAMAGLGAQKGLLLYVRCQDPLELEIVDAVGLDYEQQEACRRMESTPLEGVSPSVIREALERRSPVYIPNAADATERWRTTSLAGGAHSVLCAPVMNAQGVFALLYVQSQGLLQSFEPADLHWLSGYAAALGQGLGLNQMRRTAEPATPRIVGASTWTKGLCRALDALAPTLGETPPPVLILGASGTGKRLVARYLHYYSPRHEGPCRVVSAKDLDERALASRLRETQAGFLVLEECGDLPTAAMALLLRVLEMHELPAGDESTRTTRVDVQVMATSSSERSALIERPLWPEFLARAGQRLTQLLPLRAPERQADIEPLLDHFLDVAADEQHKRLGAMAGAARAALLAYSWPLNVREMEGVCRGLVAAARPGATLDVTDLRALYPEVVGS